MRTQAYIYKMCATRVLVRATPHKRRGDEARGMAFLLNRIRRAWSMLVVCEYNIDTAPLYACSETVALYIAYLSTILWYYMCVCVCDYKRASGEMRWWSG